MRFFIAAGHGRVRPSSIRIDEKLDHHIKGFPEATSAIRALTQIHPELRDVWVVGTAVEGQDGKRHRLFVVVSSRDPIDAYALDETGRQVALGHGARSHLNNYDFWTDAAQLDRIRVMGQRAASLLNSLSEQELSTLVHGAGSNTDAMARAIADWQSGLRDGENQEDQRKEIRRIAQHLLNELGDLRSASAGMLKDKISKLAQSPGLFSLQGHAALDDKLLRMAMLVWLSGQGEALGIPGQPAAPQAPDSYK